MKKSKKSLIISIVFASILLLCAIGAFVCTFMPFIIQLNGQQTMQIGNNEKYEELGAKDIFGQDIKRIEGIVDTEKIGTYQITYYFLNAKVIRTVEVVDAHEPVLQLKGSEKVMVVINSEYKDPGYSAIDDIDGDITNRVTIAGEVDTTTLGSYTLTYNVTDSAGNLARVRRTVEVIEAGALNSSVKNFSLNGYFENTILKATKEDTTEKFNSLIWVGDSIIDNLAIYKLIPMKNTWARSKLDPENIESRELHLPRSTTELGLFFDGMDKYNPKTVLISFGTNTLPYVTVDYYVEIFTNFVDKCKEQYPNTKFIFVSILPMNIKDMNKETLNDKINKANYYVSLLCSQYGYYFINAAEIFKDSNGYPIASYYSKDGIHPTQNEGCPLLVDYIKKHLSY